MSTAFSYSHATPAFRTLSGEQALRGLRRDLDRSKQARVLIIGSPSVLRDRAASDRVREAFDGLQVTEFDGVKEHSPLPAVLQARDLLDGAGAQVVVALGGGSAVVTARAAVILHAEGKSAADLASHRDSTGAMVSPRLDAPKMPIWVVPSTPSTAYAKAGTAVRDPDTGNRLAMFDPKTRARGVAFDPGIAATAPAELVRSAALNAFSLSVEGLHREGADPLADALLWQGLQLERQWLPKVGVDPTAPLALMSAALLSGQGSDFARGGLAQGLSHILGPRSTVANGVVEAMLVPSTTTWDALASSTAGYPLIALAIGASSSNAADVVEALRRVVAELGVPERLREIGIDRADLAEFAREAADDWAIASRPHPPTVVDLERLLDDCW